MPSRILIIDDNVALAENLRDVLEGARELDVEVELAPDGHRGLAAARKDGFDVAVVDVKLPDVAGVDLIRPLHAASEQGEIILVTGFATLDTAIAALRAGAFAFVLKSFRPDELISNVAQALEKIALKRERAEYERRYRALVDAADVLIVGLDSKGCITLWNPKLAALTGVGPEAATGQRFAEGFVEEPDHKRFEHALATAFDGEKPEVEVDLRDAAGAVRRVRFHLSSVHIAGQRSVDITRARPEGRDAPSDITRARPEGRDAPSDITPARPVGRDAPGVCFGIGIDITERRALERRAADAVALNAMAPLALGLAHEIRNPLNAAVLELHLLGRGIERLADPGVRDPMKRRVGIVEGEIKRLERLLTEFLELARPRAPQREPVDLARVVSDVIELEAGAIAARKVSVVRDLLHECHAIGDVEKLKQVALNLVVNALDAMPDGGVLRVGVGGDDGEVWMSIGDDGPGIDPAILADIFDPFFTTKPAGTGLGLSIVSKIVDQHQGRVEIDTKKAVGTTVRVVLPRLSAHGTPRPPSAKPPAV